MPWITLILRNLKLVLVTLCVSALITSGVWLYFHGKSVAGMQISIEALESQIAENKRVRDIVNDVEAENIAIKDNIIESQRKAIMEIGDAKRNDKDVSDYYDRDYPERLRTIRERARCVSLPYLCNPDESE